MEDRSVKIGLVTFFIALLLIGVPTTMPFSDVNDVNQGSSAYELVKTDTTNATAPEKMVAYRDLKSEEQQLVERAIAQNESRASVANISVGEAGLPLGEGDEPTVVGVQYEGDYYEFQARLTVGSTRADVDQTRDQLILTLGRLGLLVAIVGFVYYTEFGGPHSFVPALTLGGLAVWIWLLTYVAPFQNFTTQSVRFVYLAEIVGVGLFVGVSVWRYFDVRTAAKAIENLETE